jgi:hypothetical protein
MDLEVERGCLKGSTEESKKMSNQHLAFNGRPGTGEEEDEAKGIQNFKDHFGTCPHCHDYSDIINIGRSHWMICETHKTKWWLGSNLFSSWRDQTEDEQRAIYDAKGIDTFDEVKPCYPAPTDAEIAERAEAKAKQAVEDSKQAEKLRNILYEIVSDQIGSEKWRDLLGAEIYDALRGAFAGKTYTDTLDLFGLPF